MRTYRIQSNLGTLPVTRAVDSTSSNETEYRLPRPRVLMVGMHLEKTRGGISTLISEILNSDVKLGANIEYIPSQAEDHGKFRKLLLAFGAIARFTFSAILRGPDLIYVHIGSNASLYREGLFVLLGKMFGRPVLTHFHAGDVEHYYPRQPPLGRWFIRKALIASDALIAVSKSSAIWLRALEPKAEVVILPNAIDTSVFCFSRDDEETSSSEIVPKVLFVGAMGKLKGETDLLSALARLKDRGVSVTASFLGFGSEEPAKFAEQLGLNRMIDHMGPVSLEERIDFFQKADIFVLPTYAEAMPMSVIEAMASGLPVITTPVGGIPELIEDGVEGLFFPCGDVKALADRIETLINDPELRNEIGRNAQEKARAHFDISGYAKRLSDVMNSVTRWAR